MNTQCPIPRGVVRRRRGATGRAPVAGPFRRRAGRGFAGAAWISAALLVAVAPLAALAGDVPRAALERRVGHAYALDTGRLVYREIHEPVVEDGRLLGDRVSYVDPGGEVFARKRVAFAPDALAPTFRLEEERTGYVEGLRRPDGGGIELFKRKGPDAPFEQATLDPQPRTVADAGFDILIYRQLERLKAGEQLEFPFAAPSQLDVVRFRLRRIDRREVLGEPAVVIRMEPANMFIRWLANPIDVAYHADTGALLRYEGLSNIPDPDADGNYRVRIDFPPAGAEPQPPGDG